MNTPPQAGVNKFRKPSSKIFFLSFSLPEPPRHARFLLYVYRVRPPLYPPPHPPHPTRRVHGSSLRVHGLQLTSTVRAGDIGERRGVWKWTLEIGEAGTHRSEERRVPLVGPWPLSAPSYQMMTTTTTATRASIHDPPRRNLHLHCAFSAPPARYPSSPLFSLHVHRRPPQKQSSLHIKTQPQPQPRIFVSSSAHLHCRFLSIHLPYLKLAFSLPASCIYNQHTHTPLVSP